MVKKVVSEIFNAVIVDDQQLTFLDICRAVGVPAETIVEMVEYGVIEPIKGQRPANWQFSAQALKRTRIATRLRQDLRINLAGLSLAMDLLEEVQALRQRVHFYEQHLNDRD